VFFGKIFEIHREYEFHSLKCVYRNCLNEFSHILYWENIWEPRGDRIIMESALYRTVSQWSLRYIGSCHNGVLII